MVQETTDGVNLILCTSFKRFLLDETKSQLYRMYWDHVTGDWVSLLRRSSPKNDGVISSDVRKPEAQFSGMPDPADHRCDFSA